jgi:MFS transporter, DHA1 family, inner membrane transport protein
MRGSLAASRPQWPIAALLTMSAAVFLSVTTELLPTGLLPAMSRDLGVTHGQLGLLVTTYAVMVALFAAPLGVALGRVPRRTLLVAALVGYGLCNTITAVSDTYPLTVGARVIGGLTHGIFWGMLGGYAAQIVPPERVGRAVTIVSAGGPAAGLLGVPAGTALGVAFGWRTAFLICAGGTVVLVLVALRLLPTLPGRSAAAPVPMHQVMRLPGLALIVAITALTMLGHYSFFTYVAPFLLHAGLTAAAIGPVLLGCGALGVLGLMLAGASVDRRPLAGMLAGLISLTIAFAVLAVAGTSAVPAIVASAATGIALGSLPVLLQTATLRAAPGASDQASALNASAFNVGIGGGALLGGITLDQWGPGALPIVAGVLTGLGLLTLLLGRQVAVTAPATG